MADTANHVPDGEWQRIARPMADPVTGKLPDQSDVRYARKLVVGNSGLVGSAADSQSLK
jgi:hypothetical protein